MAAVSVALNVLVTGDNLHLEAPLPLPDDLMEELRLQKLAVIAYLMGEDLDGGISTESILLAWACEIAEQELVFVQPVSFHEVPLRTVTTSRVSWYAAHYLRIVGYSRSMAESGVLGRWTSAWRNER